jgi:threonine dehydratase
MTMTGLVSIDEVRDARLRLSGVAVATPLDRSRALSEQCGGEVFIKCENLQRTGSFKIRGAYNRISQMDADEKARGVVAASAGNHAQGVALGASIAGTSATVFMPEQAPLPKIEATKRYGADVRLSGKDIGATLAAAMQYAETEGKSSSIPSTIRT